MWDCDSPDNITYNESVQLMIHDAMIWMGSRRGSEMASCQKRILLVVELVPHVPGLVAVEVRMDLDLEGLSLRNALLFPNEEPIKKNKEAVEVACDVEN